MSLAHPLATGRSAEEINAILSAAKLDKKDLLAVAQVKEEMLNGSDFGSFYVSIS